MIRWINLLFNRASSYRLASVALTVLWLTTFVLSLAHVIDFSPIALVISCIVLISTTLFANRLFAKVFAIQPHNESSYITAFILFFIFSPTSTTSGLMTLGVVGVIAVASKYLLTICGRHIFNPAAIAAAIIGLTGLTGASWWIATPPLFIATLTLGVVILHKTRQIGMALVFLATAGSIIVITLINDGSTLQQALLLLMSWPLVFFVGFMLSEPLTLPPRKWQRFIEAGIAAVLFAIPFQIGTLTTNPAFALVVGNGIAYIFSRRSAISLVFTSRRKLTGTADEYIFKTDTPIHFEPGQFMEITLPHKNSDGRGSRRVFSLASPPDTSTVKFGIKFTTPSSSFKSALLALEVGQRIQATSISGDFLLPNSSTTPLLFIASGIGITPFISHLLHLEKYEQKRDINLLYRVSTIDEIAYSDTLKRVGVRVFILTESDTITTIHDWRVINTRDVTRKIVKKIIPDIRTRNIYISGSPKMVDATKKQLRSLSTQNIKTDYFDGY